MKFGNGQKNYVTIVCRHTVTAKEQDWWDLHL